MSALTLLPAAERQVRPWKNKGGTTAEIAVFPAGAGMEDFEWRLSMASVTERGPFSHFAGVDRMLAVIEGRLELAFGGGAGVVELDPDSPPHPFPGEAGVVGTPIGGPVVDLNLMTRRGRWTGRMERVALPCSFKHGAPVAILVLLGEGWLRQGGAVVPVQPFDAVLIEAGKGRALTVEAGGDAYAISLFPDARGRA